MHLLEDQRSKTEVKKHTRPHYKALYEAEVKAHNQTKAFYSRFNEMLAEPSPSLWDQFKGLFA